MRKLLILLVVVMILTNCSLIYPNFKRGGGTADWMNSDIFLVYFGIERSKTVYTPTTSYPDYLYSGIEIWKCDISTGEKKRIYRNEHNDLLESSEMKIEGNILSIRYETGTWCYDMLKDEELGTFSVFFGRASIDGNYIIGANGNKVIKVEISSGKESVIDEIDSLENENLDYFDYNEATQSYIYQASGKIIYISRKDSIFWDYNDHEYSQLANNEIVANKLLYKNSNMIVSVFAHDHVQNKTYYVEYDINNNSDIKSVIELPYLLNFANKQSDTELIVGRTMYTEDEENILKVFDGENEIMTFSFPKYSE